MIEEDAEATDSKKKKTEKMRFHNNMLEEERYTATFIQGNDQSENRP